MRISAYKGTALAVLLSLLAGCTSSGIDALDIAKPSKVDPGATASIRPMVPPAGLDVADVPQQSATTIEATTELGFASEDRLRVVRALATLACETARSVSEMCECRKVRRWAALGQ